MLEKNSNEDINKVTQENTKEYDVISITVSDGTEREFAIVDSFILDDKNYIVVSLIEGDTIVEGEYIYRTTEEEEGSINVEQITLPSEYKKVVKFYENMN
ncbi:MAG: DUF1292 domain-containing protein [Lachnospiraceae bacterium]|nr:DUF1292 domain-containing protein [Lachnospiraceae bacterium]